MAINWEKREAGLRWGFGCGIAFFIYQAFMEERMFQGTNPLWQDVLLSTICIGTPILAVFLFYWPKQKRTQESAKSEKD